MDGLLNYIGLITGAVITVVSVVLNFLNKDRYKTTTDIFRTGNDELREQTTTLREEKQTLEQTVATQRGQLVEKEKRIKELRELNSHQADFAKLLEQGTALQAQMTDNHTQTMKGLTDLAGKIAGKK